MGRNGFMGSFQGFDAFGKVNSGRDIISRNPD
jgi:hypothetical protein